MEMKILLRADLKRHRGTLFGIFFLVLLAAISLSSVLTVWQNAGKYISDERNRLSFGDMTIWVSGTTNPDVLVDELDALDIVEQTGIQEIVFSEYMIREQESDSEGQLIAYEPEKYDYKMLQNDLSGYQKDYVTISSGEIFVSSALKSMFGADVGDEISFSIARNGVRETFRIKGFYEDPFMGSSMIGMKGFLICEQDIQKIKRTIREAGVDGLARSGYMLHIHQTENGMSVADLNRIINGETQIQNFLEFSHSTHEMYGFMMTFQNVFTGLFLAFVMILFFVTMVVLGHSIVSAIYQDETNMGILKTVGITGKQLRMVQTVQYLIAVTGGIVLGMFMAPFMAGIICRLTVTTIGVLVPSMVPYGMLVMIFILMFCLFTIFISFQTKSIQKSRPLEAIISQNMEGKAIKVIHTPLEQKGLLFFIAIRQIVSAGKRYLGIGMVAMLLVLSSSVIGRVDTWLGVDGKGLMDAFNPADLHLAAQPVGNVSIEEVEDVILQYTNITDRYTLGMPVVSVEGIDYTANVITDPQRFHILEGRTIETDEEILITEYVAADLNLTIGDTVTITGNKGETTYVITGIYQCANDMGENIGMSREGYDLISTETEQMWCHHYFIQNEEMRPQIMQALEESFGGNVYLHENTWPGLFGILSAMRILMIFMYAIITMFILIVTFLNAGRFLRIEQSNMGIYQAAGFRQRSIRIMFTLKFVIAAFIGTLAGGAAASLLTNPLVAMLMRSFGISNFSSRPNMMTILTPVIFVIMCFALFAWMSSARIKRMDLTTCITEK